MGMYSQRRLLRVFLTTKLAQVVQTLEARYIEGAAMVALLIRLFGRGNFSIDVRFLRLLLIFVVADAVSTKAH